MFQFPVKRVKPLLQRGRALWFKADENQVAAGFKSKRV